MSARTALGCGGSTTTTRVNIFENGFLNEFNAARNNLLIFAHQANSPCVIRESGGLISIVSGTCNYGNSGLPGQVDMPLITTAINSIIPT